MIRNQAVKSGNVFNCLIFLKFFICLFDIVKNVEKCRTNYVDFYSYIHYIKYKPTTRYSISKPGFTGRETNCVWGCTFRRRYGMYLSELFLMSVEHDMSVENVKKAVCTCDREMRRRMEKFESKEDCVSYFFYKSGKNRRINASGEEILDFWDVYREFDTETGANTGNDCELLKVCRIMRQILKEYTYKRVIPFSGE